MIRRSLAGCLFALVLCLVAARAQIGPIPGVGPVAPFALQPIGTPSTVGTSTNNSSTNSSITITTSAAIVARNLVTVFVSFAQSSGITVSSVSDGTNTYSKAVSEPATGMDGEIWYCSNVAAVASGATITINLSGTTTGGFGFTAASFQVSGANGAVDAAAGNTTNTATPSVSTGTLNFAYEIVFGFSAQQSGGTIRTYTPAPGFTNLTTLQTASQWSVGMDYKNVLSTASVTYAPTWSGTAGNAMATMATSFRGQS